MTIYVCQNCGFAGPRMEFNPISNPLERFDPGDAFSDRECPLPDCGAVALPWEQIDRALSSWLSQFLA